MDLETMYDAVSNVGIKDGRIAVITNEKIAGKEIIDCADFKRRFIKCQHGLILNQLCSNLCSPLLYGPLCSSGLHPHNPM